MKKEAEAKELYRFDLWFEKIIKIVETFLKAKPSWIYMGYSTRRHKRRRKYDGKLSKIIIYAGLYKIEDHSYRVIRYKKENDKIYVHVTVKYAN